MVAAAEVKMRRISLPTVDITYLDVDGNRLASFDHDRKDPHLPAQPLNQRQFLAVLYAMIIVGCHWNYIDPIAADDLHRYLEIDLGLVDDPG